METGVTNLENSIDLTNIWLKDIMNQLKWQSKKRMVRAAVKIDVDIFKDDCLCLLRTSEADSREYGNLF